MSTLNLRVSSEKISYELNILRRITFIQGNSGTGKTTLGSLLSDRRNNPLIECVCDLEVYNVTGYDSYGDAQVKRNCVIFIDEDFVNIVEILTLVKNCVDNNNYILIVSRSDKDITTYFEVSLYSICKFVYHEGVNYLVENYNFNRLDSLDKFDNVITEDSNAGFELLQQLHPNVISSTGNGNIIRKVLENPGSTIVFMDTANYGKHASEFKTLVWDIREDVTIVPYYECFEEFILRSNFFKDDNDVIDLFRNLPEYCNDYVNWENKFEEVSESTSLKYKPFAKYKHGKHLPICYRSVCGNSNICTNQRKLKCTRSLEGEDKLYELYKGTKYEYIIHLLRNR